MEGPDAIAAFDSYHERSGRQPFDMNTPQGRQAYMSERLGETDEDY